MTSEATSLAPAPPGRTTYRCTFTLPIPLAKAISDVAKRLGISQSALLTQVLDQPLQDLLGLLEVVPPGGAGAAEKLRWTGRSADLIRQRVREAIAAAEGLSPKLL